MFFPPPIEDLHRIYQPFLFSSFLSSLLFSAVDFLFVTSIPENPWNLTKVSVNLVKKKKRKSEHQSIALFRSPEQTSAPRRKGVGSLKRCRESWRESLASPREEKWTKDVCFLTTNRGICIPFTAFPFAALFGVCCGFCAKRILGIPGI